MNKFIRLSVAAMAAMHNLAQANAEEPPTDVSSFYNPNEERGSFDLIMKPYPIPIETTTYVDFYFNIPDNLPDIFHVVMGEVINSQPLHLHHFVLYGCPDKIDPSMEGMPVQFDFDSSFSEPTCTTPLGQWAPGANVFNNLDLDTGFLMGKALGVQAFQLNVHYTDGAYEDPETMTKKLANDGIRVHYTTDFRPYTNTNKPVINIGFAGRELQVPSGESRFFVTKTCKVNTSCKDTSPETIQAVASFLGMGDQAAGAAPGGLSCASVKAFCNIGGMLGNYIQQLCPVSCGYCGETEGEVNPLNPVSYRATGVNYHAHLLGREMYTTLVREDSTESTVAIQKSAANNDTPEVMVKDLKSAEFWIYDFQETIPFDFEDIVKDDGSNEIMRGTEIKAGDKIQATCVYDSTYRDEATAFGLSTYDEMCITTVVVTFETPASLQALGNGSAAETDSKINPIVELNLMTFTCDADEETDIYTGVLAQDEDARDIWKNHPISDAQGCTFPNNEFSVGIFQSRNCPQKERGESRLCAQLDNAKMLEDELAGASCQGGDHNERDTNDGLTEQECIEGGGTLFSYTCEDIDNWIHEEGMDIDGETMEYLIEYWWQDKCCDSAEDMDAESDSSSEDGAAMEKNEATSVSMAESAASGLANASMFLALISAAAAMIL